jgi:hypothetical protein
MKRLVVLVLLTVVMLSGKAWAATPPDPRVTDATAAWAHGSLYVDPDFVSIADSNELLKVIKEAKVPVYVAVVPTGHWFPEAGDEPLLAGRLAAANGKPGVYVVMNGDTTWGAVHELSADAPDTNWSTKLDEPLSAQLGEYLGQLRTDERSTPEPARTAPYPPEEPDPSSPEEKFTVGKAIGNSLGGAALGLLGGFILGIIVLMVALGVARQLKGRS